MRYVAIALVFLLAACGSDSGFSIPADRPILDFTGSGAIDSNKGQLPSGFSTPDPQKCASDTTRAYILELFNPMTASTPPQVLWHWAPVVSGPDATKPTLQRPEFYVAGTVSTAEVSTTDVLADHPFGFDFDVDVMPDAKYAFLAYRYQQSTALHTEVETRAFPNVALGFTPQAGDRALMHGSWVLDCGHPPYFAEMHPPSFFSYARQLDANTTMALAVFEPYRSTQFYTQDAAKAVDLTNTGRFSLLGSKPFSLALTEAIQTAVISGADHLLIHPMLEANRFSSLDFFVCAPNPRPAGAKLTASYRFTARTGVSIDADVDDSAGCVRFLATMGSDYAPQAVTLKTAPWSWNDLNATASQEAGTPVDVRQAIIAGNPAAANAPALQADHDPQVDTYDPLAPLSGADQESPTQISSKADGQPFPFYGRVRVAWSP